MRGFFIDGLAVGRQFQIEGRRNNKIAHVQPRRDFHFFGLVGWEIEKSQHDQVIAPPGGALKGQHQRPLRLVAISRDAQAIEAALVDVQITFFASYSVVVVEGEQHNAVGELQNLGMFGLELLQHKAVFLVEIPLLDGVGRRGQANRRIQRQVGGFEIFLHV